MLTFWHSWPVFLARYYTRDLWRAMPGPMPVKLALFILLLALIGLCQLVPGQFDDVLVVLAVNWLRNRSQKKGS